VFTISSLKNLSHVKHIRLCFCFLVIDHQTVPIKFESLVPIEIFSNADFSNCYCSVQRPKAKINPCENVMMRLINAMEASGGKINGPVYKYVKEVEECCKKASAEQQRSGKAGTLYYLSQYLDPQKFKKK